MHLAGRALPPPMAVNPMPEGYHTVTPYLAVADVAHLIDFLKQTFDAEETERLTRPDGTTYHAEVRIGDSTVMMGEPAGDAEESPETPGTLYVYVEDTDATYARALQAGATSIMEPTDMFWGDRNAGVQDAFGNLWYVATHFEDVPPDEIRRLSDEHVQHQHED